MIKHQAGIGIHLFTRRRQFQTTPYPLHQGYSIARIQRPQAFGYRRLTDVQQICRPCNATLFDNGSQGRPALQVRQAYIFHIGI